MPLSRAALLREQESMFSPVLNIEKAISRVSGNNTCPTTNFLSEGEILEFSSLQIHFSLALFWFFLSEEP